jgi:hypothetical protein
MKSPERVLVQFLSVANSRTPRLDYYGKNLRTTRAEIVHKIELQHEHSPWRRVDRCHTVGWLVEARHAFDPSVHSAPVEVWKPENFRKNIVERAPVPDPARIEFDDWILQELRFSNPLISPESIRAISSKSALSCSCRSGGISVCRTASSKSGTHSCTLPRAIPKKFLLSGFDFS